MEDLARYTYLLGIKSGSEFNRERYTLLRAFYKKVFGFAPNYGMCICNAMSILKEIKNEYEKNDFGKVL